MAGTVLLCAAAVYHLPAGLKFIRMYIIHLDSGTWLGQMRCYDVTLEQQGCAWDRQVSCYQRTFKSAAGMHVPVCVM
jgi:hypothetical protein